MTEAAVVDTVVLRYFLFVDRIALLLDLLGRPLHVPRVVYDPEDPDAPEPVLSEITRSIRVQQSWAADASRVDAARQEASRNVERLEAIAGVFERGEIEIEDLTEEERASHLDLLDQPKIKELGLSLPLGRGEAACVAIAVHRTWILATDDSDALKALEALSPGHPYERIRRLLRRAAQESLVTAAQANEIHQEMTLLGFRDQMPPFPEG